MSVRTTLAIDEDNYLRLQDAAKQRQESFRAVVNEALRRGLDSISQPQSTERFVVHSFPTGPLPGLDFDNIGELMEYLEGPFWR